MFKFAASGIITWPTVFPVDTDGNVVPTTVLVRYRVLTRKELREIDNTNTTNSMRTLAETLANVMTPSKLTSDAERAAEQQRKAEETMAAIEEAQRTGNQREEARAERVRARLVSIQPPGESEFREFAPGELDRHLEFEPLLAAYERGLFDASRGAVAKN